MDIRDKRLLRKLIAKQTISSLISFSPGAVKRLYDLMLAFDVDIAKARLSEQDEAD